MNPSTTFRLQGQTPGLTASPHVCLRLHGLTAGETQYKSVGSLGWTGRRLRLTNRRGTAECRPAVHAANGMSFIGRRTVESCHWTPSHGLAWPSCVSSSTGHMTTSVTRVRRCLTCCYRAPTKSPIPFVNWLLGPGERRTDAIVRRTIIPELWQQFKSFNKIFGYQIFLENYVLYL